MGEHPDELPVLKQIVGALVFGANRPIGIPEMKRCILEVAEKDEETAVYAELQTKDITEAVKSLRDDLLRQKSGFTLEEVAGGWRLQSSPSCGRWLKHLLKAKPQRLSQPALETLAIIAYRQPISKSDIESIRGVGVSHIIKGLMETQLVKIVGRSELPGRPFLYGTTALFLDHFGLKALKDLKDMGPRMFARKANRAATSAETEGSGEEESLFANDAEDHAAQSHSKAAEESVKTEETEA